MPSGLHCVCKVAEASLLLAPWKTLCFVAVVMMREMLHSFNLTLFIFGAQLLFTIHTGFAFHPKQKEPGAIVHGVFEFFCHVGSFIIQRFIDLFMDTKRPPRT
jgi:hypothetical protein